MNKAELASLTIVTRILNRLPLGSRLPSSRAMSRSLRLGRSCVASALRILEQSGRIARYGRGYKVTGIPSTLIPMLDAADDPMSVRQAVAQQIRKSLTRWGSSRDQLPGIAEWASTLGCSQKTAKQALVSLESEGFISHTGRKWIRRSTQPLQAVSGSIYLVSSPRAVISQDYFHLAFIGAVEEELSWRRWGALQTYLSDDPESLKQTPVSNASGFIHLSYGFNSEWTAFFKNHLHVPLVIADFTEHQFRWELDSHKLLRAIFRPDNRKAALQMGLYLRETGHAHCAFIAPHSFKQHRWVVLRYEGLCSAFAGRTPVYLEAPAIKKEERTVFDDAAGLVKTANHQNILPESLAARIKNSLFDAASAARQMGAFRVVFDKLRENRRITAWVCANDMIAVMACHYLQQMKISVPHDICVVGFDNSPLSYHEQITSYDFGYHAMGRLCIEALARGSIYNKQTGAASVDGTLIVRKSSLGNRR